ncbi:DUF6075 family protein [Enterococcus gallinarum]|uniref:DUF6075 family protein n=1 Tax=Enterococcus gallinarum TaxID=1353 RepID=A0ABD4ZUI2_ENTGA|nr:DUF6075 family protein [Enterococcus gallinarum]MBF0823683.1 hypothetical protein [Enterococcus faecalis]MBF0725190.1 hypothetical protein [Enterococcus gallinarum]MBF0798239.1 hypothetical protein [Enterococcus gallinarum]MBX8978682.1 hypothetical protein [Enterococcus gallinarum]MDL4875682.1 DUF6075 family protein [Enterococcus gallinarum]
MKELILNKDHMAKFSYMMEELGFEDLRDPYWTSLSFIVTGNEKLFNKRHSLINFDQRLINSEVWFSGTLSGGEQRLIALAYNLFTNMDFYEFEDGKKYYISPLEIFSGVDEVGYKLAKNAIDVRLKFY